MFFAVTIFFEKTTENKGGKGMSYDSGRSDYNQNKPQMYVFARIYFWGLIVLAIVSTGIFLTYFLVGKQRNEAFYLPTADPAFDKQKIECPGLYTPWGIEPVTVPYKLPSGEVWELTTYADGTMVISQTSTSDQAPRDVSEMVKAIANAHARTSSAKRQ